jgi:Holliday junction resolvasome RuvABC endonuclease subunit
LDERGPVILGLDPGIATTGFGAVIVTPGSVRHLFEDSMSTKRDNSKTKTDDTRCRVALFSVRLHEIIEHLRPSFAVIEQFSPHGGAGPRSMSTSTPRLIGMMHEALRAHGVAAAEVHTRTIKRLVIGRGGDKKRKVGKDDTKRAVCLHLGITPRNEHTGDALAAAIAGSALLRERRKDWAEKIRSRRPRRSALALGKSKE